jgi:hypothetical protein
MNIFDYPKQLYGQLVDDISSKVTTALGERTATTRNYRLGNQREFIKTRQGQFNDNVVINLVGLVLDRTVSQTIGGGITLQVEGEDGDTKLAEGDWIRACLDANHQEILFHRSALGAAEGGTGYWLLLPPPAAMIGEDGKEYPRILVLDPALVTMQTMDGDWEIVVQYTHEYFDADENGAVVGHRKTIKRDLSASVETWTIQDFIQRHQNQWEPITPPMVWPWPFCPVTHWQNLPTIASVYGESDITQDKLKLQDAINADASVIRKNIRLLSNPFKWGKGSNQPTVIETGPDKLAWVGNDGEIHVENPLGDLVAAREFINWEKAVFMAGTRTVDIASFADKLGSLTNFALRVIYQDNVNKIDTKRELFGDAIEELIIHLQIMANLNPVKVSIKWPEFVPQNDMEKAQLHQIRVADGIESKQTAAEEQGLDWEVETTRMQDEQSASNNIGAALLTAFNRGGGGGLPMQAQPPTPIQPPNLG